MLSTKQTNWNLEPLFDGDDDPKMAEKREEVYQKSYEFINKWKDREDYLSDPVVLKEALDEYEEWNRFYGVGGAEGYYFWLRTSQDKNDPKLKAKFNKIEEFGKKIQNDIHFFELKVAKIPQDIQKKFLEDSNLKEYKHFLEKLFAEARYLLSEQEEKILTLKSNTSHSNWVNMTSSFLSKEEREIIFENDSKQLKSFPDMMSLISSVSKITRDSASEAINEILEKHSSSAEAEMNSILANKKVDDVLRGMERSDTSRHISDDIDSDVVDALVYVVSSRFDVAKRYYELKAKLMGVSKLAYHERSVPYGKIDKEYSYDDSVALISTVFEKLDRGFADIFKGFVENGNIDVYPKKGKSDGAFCAYVLPTHPTYILLNHTDKLKDVLTMAHEAGHGINDEFIKTRQNSMNFGTPMSTAEVASTFMEDFVLDELIKDADDDLRLAIMMNKLNDDISTIFRQVAAYKFEQNLHKDFREKGYLSKEEIGEIFQKHMFAYMGESVEQSEGSQNWWIYWGHFRRFFYVYSYASGLLISKSMQNSVKADPKFIEKVKEFLSAGLSDSPKNIFLKLGIDITDKNFWESSLDEIEKLLKETEDLAKKLGKI